MFSSGGPSFSRGCGHNAYFYGKALVILDFTGGGGGVGGVVEHPTPPLEIINAKVYNSLF